MDGSFGNFGIVGNGILGSNGTGNFGLEAFTLTLVLTTPLTEVVAADNTPDTDGNAGAEGNGNDGEGGTADVAAKIVDVGFIGIVAIPNVFSA